MKVKARRQPLAWGITRWGPLPGTADLFLFWGGPGDGMYMAKGENGRQRRIMHRTMTGPYQTVGEAERAVGAFLAVYFEETAGTVSASQR